MPPGAHCVPVTQHLQYCMERPMREANPSCYGSTEDAIPSKRRYDGEMCFKYIYRERRTNIKRKHSLLA